MAKEVGRTADVGWQIGVSRTLPYSLEDVWKFVPVLRNMPSSANTGPPSSSS